MSKVNFIHRRLIVNGNIHNSGGSTVAFREIGDSKVEYAVAYCSGVDNFNKKLGRIKAEGRLKSEKYRKVVDLDFKDFISNYAYDEVVNDFLF